MKRNVMDIFVNVCVAFVLIGLITAQLASAIAASHVRSRRLNGPLW